MGYWFIDPTIRHLKRTLISRPPKIDVGAKKSAGSRDTLALVNVCSREAGRDSI
jgi:hypothetical protein